MSMDCFEQFYLNVDTINHNFVFELTVHTIVENFSFEIVHLTICSNPNGWKCYLFITDLFIALFILDKIYIYSVKSILHLVFMSLLKKCVASGYYSL